MEREAISLPLSFHLTRLVNPAIVPDMDHTYRTGKLRLFAFLLIICAIMLAWSATANAKSTAKNVPTVCKSGTHRTNHVTTVTVKVHGKRVHERVKGCVKNVSHSKPSTGTVGPAGPIGPQGAKGDTGNTGVTGTPGPQGTTGATGPAGATGSQGAAGPVGATGIQGPVGVTGPQGPQGEQGTPAPTSKANWARVDRNTEGNGSAILQPNGLVISTGSNTDKVEFGNQVDFAGNSLPDSTSLSVFITGEDLTTYALNAPNVTMEINPGAFSGIVGQGAGNGTLAGATFSYASLNQVLPATTVLIPNAVNTLDQDSYYLTGAAGQASGCNQGDGHGGGYCTMAQIKAAFPAATISYSVGVNKGKDYVFHGYVTSLSIGSSTVYFHDSVVSDTP